MINYECNAAIRFKMSSDAKCDEDLINCAESLSLQRWNERLDSLDLGDAMGAFIRAANEEYWNGMVLNPVFMGNGFYVQMEIDQDLFKWEKGG